jgi:hypothetical protein
MRDDLKKFATGGVSILVSVIEPDASEFPAEKVIAVGAGT